MAKGLWLEGANSFLKEGIRIDKLPSYVKRVALFIREKMLTALAVMFTNLKTQRPVLSYA